MREGGREGERERGQKGRAERGCGQLAAQAAMQQSSSEHGEDLGTEAVQEWQWQSKCASTDERREETSGLRAASNTKHSRCWMLRTPSRTSPALPSPPSPLRLWRATTIKHSPVLSAVRRCVISRSTPAWRPVDLRGPALPAQLPLSCRDPHCSLGGSSILTRPTRHLSTHLAVRPTSLPLSAMSSAVDGSAQLAELRATSPHILFVIGRSKNLNIVVYEARLNQRGDELDSKEPVIVYWLDLDPAYQKQKRDKGITSDRLELNYIEKTMAYGLSSSPHPTKPGHHTVQLVAFSKRAVDVYFDQAKGRAVAMIEINGQQCELIRIFVAATDSWTGLPKVQHVDVIGLDAHGKQVTERITP